jgi:hypothetical protein
MLPDEQTATIERFERQQDRLIQHFGYGATEGARAITRNYLNEVTEGVEALGPRGVL